MYRLKDRDNISWYVDIISSSHNCWIFERAIFSWTYKQTDYFVATIETLYHAVAMLSCRSKTWGTPHRSSTSYLRQSLASSRVSSITGHEVRDQLALFPFVHYSFSLSLSVAYREMRHNKVSIIRARARTQFQSNCDVLYELGEIFWCASTMAEMGKSTLKEMDRVFTVVAVSEQLKSQQDPSNQATDIVGAGGIVSSLSNSHDGMGPPT
jgi:hypothetical protein